MPRRARAGRRVAALAVAAGLAVSVTACGGSDGVRAGAPPPSPLPAIRPVPTGTATPGAVGPTRAPSRFRVLPSAVVLPDPTLTSGHTFASVTAAQVCDLHYTMGVRQPRLNDKRKAFAAYGLDYAKHVGNYTVDHLVPLSLGGDNDPANLWPQPLRGHAAALLKDAVEVRLHDLVCAHKLPLPTAQRALSASWWAAYRHWGAVPPAKATPTFAPPVQPGEVRNGLPCRTKGVTGYTRNKHVALTCEKSTDGTLRWGKRY